MSGLDLGTALLRQMDPETAHDLAIRGLSALPPRPVTADDPVLRTQLAGLDLPNPIGLAAGLDKDARALSGLSRLGFGFVECGSVTPLPQPGNAKPRLFRLSEDRAIINRMGFNNQGLDRFVRRLEARPAGLVVGANLGANKTTEDKVDDYVIGLKAVGAKADYVTINISSPNTPGLRALQGRAALDDLLGRITQARTPDTGPVFLKIAPDLSTSEITLVVEAARAHRIDGLIVSNTTLERPDLRSARATEAGGLSGAPLKGLAMVALRAAAEAAEGQLPLIAVGGIDSGGEALARLRAGASAVQVYSALIYAGPKLVRRIKADLTDRLRAEGFSSVQNAVGTAKLTKR